VDGDTSKVVKIEGFDEEHEFKIKTVLIIFACSILTHIYGLALAEPSKIVNHSIVYSYDSLNRIRLVQYDELLFTSYAYDSSGNIYKINHAGIIKLNNILDILKSISGLQDKNNNSASDINDDSVINIKDAILAIILISKSQ